MINIEYNKQLIEKYPFLYPRNVWTDEPIEGYDYSYTELDQFPTGWRIAFGEQMCAELMEALGDNVKDFRITQIKEKFGFLHFYTNWTTVKVDKVINKYERLSRETCINCGAPATRVSTGWICPWCDDCASLIDDKTILIEEFYDEEE